MKSIIKYLFIIFLICGYLGNPYAVYAQKEKIVISGTPLAKALNYLEEKFNIKFSYNAAFINIINIDFDYQNLTLEEFMKKISGDFVFMIEKVSGNFYMVKKKAKKFCIEAYEAETEINIEGVFLNIAINDKPVKKDINNTGKRAFFNYIINPDDIVKINSFGYHTIAFSASALLESSCIRLKLKPKPTILKEVIIENYLSDGVHANLDNHSLEIDMDNLALLPGETDGDILESIKTLPGINSPDSRAGNLYIRGSATDQSLVMYDNIPIYHKGHYFGTISPYNPKVIGSIEVFRNGFQPRLGGRVGGAVDIKSTNNILKESKYGVSANALSATAFIIKPIIKNKLGLIIGARKSFPVSFNSPKLDAITDMVFKSKAIFIAQTRPDVELLDFSVDFGDLNAKILYQANDKNKFSLSGFVASNDLNHLIEDHAINISAHEYNSLSNLGLSFNWDYQLSKKVYSTLNLALSDYEFKYFTTTISNQTVLDRDTRLTNKISDFSAHYELNIALKNENQISTGFEIKSQETYFSGVNKTIIGQEFDDVFDQPSNGYSISPYLNFEIYSIKKLNLQLGLRGTYFNKLDDFRLTPRVFANYRLKEHLKLKASFGMYNQYLSKINNLRLFTDAGLDNELFMLANDKNVKIMNGFQSMAGAIFQKNKLLIDLEGYYKKTNDITNVPIQRFNTQGEYVYAELETVGMDLMVKYNFNEKITSWISYTYSESLVVFDSLPGIRYFTQYDQPHVIKIAGIYNAKRFKFSLGWKFKSGLFARFPIFEEPFKRSQGGGQNPRPPHLEEGESLEPYRGFRFPVIHMLDASLSYSLNGKEKAKWRGSVGLSIQNIYNRDNIISEALRYDKEGRRIYSFRHAIGFAPNLKVLIEW